MESRNRDACLRPIARYTTDIVHIKRVETDLTGNNRKYAYICVYSD